MSPADGTRGLGQSRMRDGSRALLAAGVAQPYLALKDYRRPKTGGVC